MATIINQGSGQRARKTKVSRMAYWKPEEGEWIYLPVDRAHDQRVLEEDEEGNSLGSRDLYESKGWIPMRMVTDPKILAKLPENWREVANHGAKASFAESAAARS